MPTVEVTRHLYRFFPAQEYRTISVAAGSVVEVLRTGDVLAPGFTVYVLDEPGALRQHVMISVNDTIVIDRMTLSERVPEEATLFILQALSGGLSERLPWVSPFRSSTGLPNAAVCNAMLSINWR
jgi:molybdopterin synthase sulfur carrier subunit